MDGKVALITGASRGIGAATAEVFAAAGAKVAIVARSADKLTALADRLGDAAHAIACDVSDYVQVERAVAETVLRFGRLDVLIGNAGVVEPIAHIESAEPDEWGRLIDINLKGVFHGMRAAVPVMKRTGGGTIITVSSGAAWNPLEAWSAYCASKAGAAMLTRSADLELRGAGFRIMGLSPGTTATEMQKIIKATGINPISQLEWSDHVPPEWPAKTMLWMCGPGGDQFLGGEVNLREERIRRAVGLID